ncbi:TetR/AcrR family transcriptional regulator [Maribellus maritimus]|uniref:TetR/AcrR family transcriptional regulator n=1 Tax=Maribellus maritimus TaxID=2870838 RepID=UPI001EEA669B|nr:TetR/AcrR family transcriptional regulator [Maribellus maritimus]MCG6188310.1 TetR/AcrR family transcriptional regulator [Maribellus maritimus]
MKSEVKENIITVAQDIFMRFGFRKTTMDEIAYAARKGKSSLYYYFKSKEEVFQAVVEKEASVLRSEIVAKVAESSSAKEKLRSYIVVRMEGFKNWGNFYVALKDEYLSNYDFIEKIRIRYDESEVNSITQIIKDGIDGGEFKGLNAELTAKTVLIAMKGLEVPLIVGKDLETNFRKEIDDMLEILFHGICA